ncbi:MAG TPA: hypothetical protein VFA41_18165 [Ktedonobacteraceae bacterium]|jgi:hypothetical protein|nr:hypothetical protein [Ktedonobacteraceae bacterium]
MKLNFKTLFTIFLAIALFSLFYQGFNAALDSGQVPKMIFLAVAISFLMTLFLHLFIVVATARIRVPVEDKLAFMNTLSGLLSALGYNPVTQTETYTYKKTAWKTTLVFGPRSPGKVLNVTVNIEDNVATITGPSSILWSLEKRMAPS